MKNILYISLMAFLLSCAHNESELSKECEKNQFCLNTKIESIAQRKCHNKPCEFNTSLAEIINKESDQILLLRKFQFDLSQSCGAIKLTPKQRNLFIKECDFIVFSKNKKLTGYIQGSCFSGIDYKYNQSIQMLDEKSDYVLNQLVKNEQKIKLSSYDDRASIQFLTENWQKFVDLPCFTDRSQQSP